MGYGFRKYVIDFVEIEDSMKSMQSISYADMWVSMESILSEADF